MWVFKMEMALLFLSALFPDKSCHKKTTGGGIINSFLQATLLTHMNSLISLLPTDIYL